MKRIIILLMVLASVGSVVGEGWYCQEFNTWHEEHDWEEVEIPIEYEYAGSTYNSIFADGVRLSSVSGRYSLYALAAYDKELIDGSWDRDSIETRKAGLFWEDHSNSQREIIQDGAKYYPHDDKTPFPTQKITHFRIKVRDGGGNRAKICFHTPCDEPDFCGGRDFYDDNPDETLCLDGLDNDHDGNVDRLDWDCADTYMSDEFSCDVAFPNAQYALSATADPQFLGAENPPFAPTSGLKDFGCRDVNSGSKILYLSDPNANFEIEKATFYVYSDQDHTGNNALRASVNFDEYFAIEIFKVVEEESGNTYESIFDSYIYNDNDDCKYCQDNTLPLHLEFAQGWNKIEIVTYNEHKGNWVEWGSDNRGWYKERGGEVKVELEDNLDTYFSQFSWFLDATETDCNDWIDNDAGGDTDMDDEDCNVGFCELISEGDNFIFEAADEDGESAQNGSDGCCGDDVGIVEYQDYEFHLLINEWVVDGDGCEGQPEAQECIDGRDPVCVRACSDILEKEYSLSENKGCHSVKGSEEYNQLNIITKEMPAPDCTEYRYAYVGPDFVLDPTGDDYWTLCACKRSEPRPLGNLDQDFSYLSTDGQYMCMNDYDPETGGTSSNGAYHWWASFDEFYKMHTITAEDFSTDVVSNYDSWYACNAMVDVDLPSWNNKIITANQNLPFAETAEALEPYWNQYWPDRDCDMIPDDNDDNKDTYDDYCDDENPEDQSCYYCDEVGVDCYGPYSLAEYQLDAVQPSTPPCWQRYEESHEITPQSNSRDGGLTDTEIWTGDSEGQEDSECGNGEREAGEECDDGNAVDDDACSNACTINDESGAETGGDDEERYSLAFKNEHFLCFNKDNENVFGQCCPVGVDCDNIGEHKPSYNKRTFTTGSSSQSLFEFQGRAASCEGEECTEFNALVNNVWDLGSDQEYRDRVTQKDGESFLDFSKIQALTFMMWWQNDPDVKIVFVDGAGKECAFPVEQKATHALFSNAWHEVQIRENYFVGNECENGFQKNKIQKFYFTGGEWVAVDNFNIVPKSDIEDYSSPMYCAGDGSWIIDLDSDKYACNAQNPQAIDSDAGGKGGYGWTGTQCCEPNDGTYVDTLRGCFRGHVISNNGLVGKQLGVPYPGDYNYDNIMYYNEKFHVCTLNDDMVDCNHGQLNPGICEETTTKCNVVGDYTCTEDGWLTTSELNSGDGAGCGKKDWLFKDAYICPELDECFCNPEFGDCDVTEDDPCVATGSTVGQHVCMDGTWTTQTGLIAHQLFKLSAYPFVITCNLPQNIFYDDLGHEFSSCMYQGPQKRIVGIPADDVTDLSNSIGSLYEESRYHVNMNEADEVVELDLSLCTNQGITKCTTEDTEELGLYGFNVVHQDFKMLFFSDTDQVSSRFSSEALVDKISETFSDFSALLGDFITHGSLSHILKQAYSWLVESEDPIELPDNMDKLYVNYCEEGKYVLAYQQEVFDSEDPETDEYTTKTLLVVKTKGLDNAGSYLYDIFGSAEKSGACENDEVCRYYELFDKDISALQAMRICEE